MLSAGGGVLSRAYDYGMETGVSCEVAGKEAVELIVPVLEQLEGRMPEDDAARAHILEHVIGIVSEEAAILRGQTPQDILADAMHSAASAEEWLADLDEELLGQFFYRIKQRREASDH